MCCSLSEQQFRQAPDAEVEVGMCHIVDHPNFQSRSNIEDPNYLFRFIKDSQLIACRREAKAGILAAWCLDGKDDFAFAQVPDCQ